MDLGLWKEVQRSRKRMGREREVRWDKRSQVCVSLCSLIYFILMSAKDQLVWFRLEYVLRGDTQSPGGRHCCEGAGDLGSSPVHPVVGIYVDATYPTGSVHSHPKLLDRSAIIRTGLSTRTMSKQNRTRTSRDVAFAHNVHTFTQSSAPFTYHLSIAVYSLPFIQPLLFCYTRICHFL